MNKFDYENFSNLEVSENGMDSYPNVLVIKDHLFILVKRDNKNEELIELKIEFIKDDILKVISVGRHPSYGFVEVYHERSDGIYAIGFSAENKDHLKFLSQRDYNSFLFQKGLIDE